MKKILLFVSAIFFAGYAHAQSVDDWNFTPLVTDNNMSVIFTPGSLNDYIGDSIIAYGNNYNSPVSAAYEIDSDGAAGVPVVGTDSKCNCDYADNNEEIQFVIKKADGTVVYITSIDPPVIYEANKTTFSTGSTISTVPAVLGCMNSIAINHDPTAQFDDGLCIITGCTDENSDTFYDEATQDDGSCEYWGCMDVTDCNYSASANVDKSEYCSETHVGCMDSLYLNYDSSASCSSNEAGTPDCGDLVVKGCMSVWADNYDSSANVDDGSCFRMGCTSDWADNFDALATDDNGSCYREGCDDSASDTYDSLATDNDGSCEYWGCMDAEADNFDDGATHDPNDECLFSGCVNPSADNFDSRANVDDGSCTYSTINPFGPGGGTEEDPTYITSNNMSFIIPVKSTTSWGGDNLEVGDILFATYVTETLDVPEVAYSAVSGIKSSGAIVWSGEDEGAPVFGSDDYDQGFADGEEIVWLVKSNDTIYEASVTYTIGDHAIYESGEFAQITSITKGAPFYDGCMDATAPNYNPLASSDDGSCEESYSLGCLDESKVDYAGPGANPTHDNADNYGNPFLENYTIDLSNGEVSASGVAANLADNSLCQDQVEGCTDPMANNYDPYATQNDETVCDWSLSEIDLYEVDEDGFSTGTQYDFGYVDSENVNEGFKGSEFGNANVLFNDGALDGDAHVIENLATVMEWIDADEYQDSVDYAVLDSTWASDYYLNDSTWSADYDTLDAQWQRTYDDTLAAVAVWFAEDELKDSLELADSLTDNYRRFFVNDSTWSADYDTLNAQWQRTYDDTLAAVAVWFAEDERLDSIAYAELDSTWNSNFEIMVEHKDSVIQVTRDTLAYHRAPLEINLQPQWNMIGYYLHHESPVVAQFETQFGGHEEVKNHINIVKNNEGLFYWPEFSFDGLGMLIPGQGYQVRVDDYSAGKADFVFLHSINADAYRVLNPTVPQWAIEMPVEQHPNDIRTLIRVVNMLGQEVNPAEQFTGEVLLYLYNDGTVEKKMTK